MLYMLNLFMLMALDLGSLLTVVLDLLKEPIIIPGIISVLLFLGDKYTSLLERVPGKLKIVIMILVPAGIQALSSATGIDATTFATAAAGIYSALQVKLGQIKKEDKLKAQGKLRT